jgi:hypothetical protein
MRHSFRFSGMVAPDDRLHQLVAVPPGATQMAIHEISPTTVTVTITNPGLRRQVGIAQYAPTTVGGSAGYDPSGDCNGSFMSAKYQSNNNCYAYGCNIATNTFPQPGRAHGNLITAATLNGPSIRAFAEQDGLVYAGATMVELKSFANARTTQGQADGHYVALMISSADGQWTGDYHWARCDDSTTLASWSQKDGGDQVTNFDFAGAPITDPSTANWTVNQGPANPPQDVDDLVIAYDFYCFMFVPANGVSII